MGLPWRAGTQAGAYNGRATAPLPVGRSVGRPRGGGGGGNRREDAKEASESGLGGRGPTTDRCNKGLEGLADWRAAECRPGLTQTGRVPWCTHAPTALAALSTATHAKKREGRKEE